MQWMIMWLLELHDNYGKFLLLCIMHTILKEIIYFLMGLESDTAIGDLCILYHQSLNW